MNNNLTTGLITNNKKNSSIFNRWRIIQKEIQKSRLDSIKDKRKYLPLLKSEYDSLMAMTFRKSDGSYEFNFSFLIRAIKYINNTYDFFNRKLKIGDLDEILLLIYIFEWVCLNKEKDPSLLGSKDEVINRLKVKVTNSQSVYKEIFDNIDLSNPNDFEEFKRRIIFYVKKTHDKLINVIFNDINFYSSIEQTKNLYVDFDNFEVCNKVWRDTFNIFDDKVDYLYDLENSDDTIIFISIEANNRQVAFIKFRMFETFTSKNSKIVPSGFSKEILRIDFVNKAYENMIGVFLSNSLKIANRVIKNIFLPELQLELFKNEKHETVNNSSKFDTTTIDKDNKVVKIITNKKVS